MSGGFDRGRYVPRNGDMHQRNYYNNRPREQYERRRDYDQPLRNDSPPRRNNNYEHVDNFGRFNSSPRYASRYGQNDNGYSSDTVEFRPDAAHIKVSDDPRSHPYGNGERSARAAGNNEPPPVLLSLREFMHRLDARIPEQAALERYAVYKRDFKQKALSKFFDERKEQEWFREKYEPEERRTREKLKRARLLRRRDIFLWLMEHNFLDSLVLETDYSESIVKILDAVVSKLESEQNNVTLGEEQEAPKTSSIFLKNVAPTITKSELEAVLRKHDGYLRLCMSEPMPDRNFYRRAWITFRHGVNVKDISWKMDTLRMRDSALGAVVNKDLSRRCRPVDGFYAHAPVARECLKLATRLVEVLDAQLYIWSKPPPPPSIAVSNETKLKHESSSTERDSKRHKHSDAEESGSRSPVRRSRNNSTIRNDDKRSSGDKDERKQRDAGDSYERRSDGKRKYRESSGDEEENDADDIAPKINDNVRSPEDDSAHDDSMPPRANPVLQGITHFLIDEEDTLEEELLGAARKNGAVEKNDQMVSGEKVAAGEQQPVQRDAELLAALDKVITYLRIVHSIDFYTATEYPLEDEMPQRCGLIHVRNSDERVLPIDFNADQVVEKFRQRTDPLFRQFEQSKISDEEVQELGVRVASDYVEKFIAANVVSLGPEKYICPLSNKKFKAAEFVRKHILNKHMERLNEVRREVEFFNNFLRDPKRPMPVDSTPRNAAAGPVLNPAAFALPGANLAMMNVRAILQQQGNPAFMNPAQMMTSAFAAAMTSNMARFGGVGADGALGFANASAVMSRFGSSAAGIGMGGRAPTNVSYDDLDQSYESDLF